MRLGNQIRLRAGSPQWRPPFCPNPHRLATDGSWDGPPRDRALFPRSLLIGRQSTRMVTHSKICRAAYRSAMRFPDTNGRLRASRCDQHLHREEFGENQMLAGDVTRFPAFRKMNRANRITLFSMNKLARH